jgi:hypothetical protein
MDQLKKWLSRDDVPLIMKMNELEKNGPTADFLDLWKIVRVFIWKGRQNGNTLNGQELAVEKRLRRMAKYKRSQPH